MEKYFAMLLVGGVIAFSSCSRNTSVTSDSDSDTRIISKDTVEVQYKVEETQVEIDTIRNTETIKVNPQNDKTIEGDNQNQNQNENQELDQNQDQDLNQNQDLNQDQNLNDDQIEVDSVNVEMDSVQFENNEQ